MDNFNFYEWFGNTSHQMNINIGPGETDIIELNMGECQYDMVQSGFDYTINNYVSYY